MAVDSAQLINGLNHDLVPKSHSETQLLLNNTGAQDSQALLHFFDISA